MPPAKPRPADHLRLVTPATVTVGTVSARPRAAAAPTRSLGDWMLHGLGIGAATASAGFATYALIFSTGEVVPSGNFNLFARYDRLYQAPGAQHASPKATDDAAAPAARVETADKGGVDFAPTGSLAGPSAALPGPGAARRFNRGMDAPALPDFTLRDVFDGKALVESHSSLSVVKPGSVLDGAGAVLSIEKRGEHWVVLTENGIIAGQKR